MKTLISTLICLSIFFSIGFSQEDSLLKDKKGRIILPEKGDFSIGIGANPFLLYLGNMFSLAGENQLNLSLFNNQLYWKYFISSQKAIRIRLGLYQNSQQTDYKIRDDNDFNLFVTDKLDRAYNNLDMTLGYELRKGSNRLQISYGAEINLKFSNLTEKFSYGNKHSSSNPFPTSYLFGSSWNRPLETNQNNGLGIGARFFTGIEYFMLPKISIGGELGIGYIKRLNGKSIQKVEYWDWDTNSVRIDDYGSNFNSSTSFTDILNGQIFILFHF
jgi:hypothetical protein